MSKINIHRIKSSSSNFNAVNRIFYMAGELVCVAPCEEVHRFDLTFDPATDGDEVEELILAECGWGETGLCPVCEAERNAADAADSAMRDAKAGRESAAEHHFNK